MSKVQQKKNRGRVYSVVSNKSIRSVRDKVIMASCSITKRCRPADVCMEVWKLASVPVTDILCNVFLFEKINDGKSSLVETQWYQLIWKKYPIEQVSRSHDLRDRSNALPLYWLQVLFQKHSLYFFLLLACR